MTVSPAVGLKLVILDSVSEALAIHALQQAVRAKATKRVALTLNGRRTRIWEDVWVAARNSHVVSLEALSHMSAALQDALSTVCTGGGYAPESCIPNSEETVINLRRPVVLNGIAVIVTAQDLLDRSIYIGLPRIEQRALASEVETSFQERQPYLLGALLGLGNIFSWMGRC